MTIGPGLTQRHNKYVMGRNGRHRAICIHTIYNASVVNGAELAPAHAVMPAVSAKFYYLSPGRILTDNVMEETPITQ